MNTGRSQESPAPRPEPEVHSITGAANPHSDDLDARIRRYLFSMAIRTACVVLAFVVHGPARWVFLVGAVGLPYIAVVMANVAGGQRRTTVPKVSAQPLPGLVGGEPTDRTMAGVPVSAQTYRYPAGTTRQETGAPDPRDDGSPLGFHPSWSVTDLTDGTRIDLSRAHGDDGRESSGHGSDSAPGATTDGGPGHTGQTDRIRTEPTSRGKPWMRSHRPND